MYKLRNVLKQEPNAIRETVIAVLGLLVTVGVIDVSAEIVAAAGVGISMLLGLFYVRPLTASTDALSKLTDAETGTQKPRRRRTR